MAETLFQQMTDALKKKDYDGFVRIFSNTVRISNSAEDMDTPEVRTTEEALNQISDYLNVEPRIAVEDVLGILDAGMRYRGDRLVTIGKKSEEMEAKVRKGEIKGTDFYKNHPKALTDLADQMAYDGLIADEIAAAALLPSYLSTYGEEPIPKKRQVKGAVENVEEYMRNGNYGMMRTMLGYLAKEKNMTAEEAERLRVRGEHMYDKADREYGLKKTDDGYQMADQEIADQKLKELDEKALRKLKDYTAGLNQMKKKAQTYLGQLTKLAGSSRNADLFQDMVDALTAVTKLDAKKSPAEISKAMQKLEKTSKDYEEYVDSSVMRGILSNGRARRKMAVELQGFATEQDKLLKAKEGGLLMQDKSLDTQRELFTMEMSLLEEKSKEAMRKSGMDKGTRQPLDMDQMLVEQKAEDGKKMQDARREKSSKRQENEKKGIVIGKRNHTAEGKKQSADKGKGGM